jgi:hypothetical protein
MRDENQQGSTGFAGALDAVLSARGGDTASPEMRTRLRRPLRLSRSLAESSQARGFANEVRALSEVVGELRRPFNATAEQRICFSTRSSDTLSLSSLGSASAFCIEWRNGLGIASVRALIVQNGWFAHLSTAPDHLRTATNVDVKAFVGAGFDRPTPDQIAEYLGDELCADVAVDGVELSEDRLRFRVHHAALPALRALFPLEREFNFGAAGPNWGRIERWHGVVEEVMRSLDAPILGSAILPTHTIASGGPADVAACYGELLDGDAIDIWEWE